jgi:GNAT superfamily N-acetyltransferase
LKDQIIFITEDFRTEAISLVQEFFKLVNSLNLDGIFKIKSSAAKKMTDIYLKLSGTGKVLFIGYLEKNELVSLLIAKSEDRPYLEEEKILYIDLAITKKNKQNNGYMKSLLDFTYKWAKKKDFKIIELRAIKENRAAVNFWLKNEFEDFYIRFRKKI